MVLVYVLSMSALSNMCICLFIFKKLTLASGSFNSMNVTQMAEQVEDVELQRGADDDSRPVCHLSYVEELTRSLVRNVACRPAIGYWYSFQCCNRVTIMFLNMYCHL